MSEGLVRWSGLAAMVAGAILILLVFLVEVLPEVFGYLFLLVFLLLGVALHGLHARQAGQSGLLGRIGFVVALIGTLSLTVLFALVGVAELFFGFDPEEQEVPVLELLLLVLFLAFVVGITLFGIATIRAGVLPSIAAVLFAFGVPLSLVLDLLTGAFFDEELTPWGFYIGIPLFAIGLLWLGYALWSGRGGSSQQSPRVR